MTPRQIGALLLLSLLWGLSSLFVKVAAPALGPVLLAELRVLIAGLALLAYGLVTRSLPALRGDWPRYLVVGALNFAIPATLIATASLSLPASVFAALNATTPIFGAIIAALWLHERLTLPRLLGLLLGFAGVSLLVGLGPVPLTSRTLLAGGASLLAALSYGLSAVYTKVHLQGRPPQAMATYSQLFAALLITPGLPFSLPAQPPSIQVIGIMLALALLSSAWAFMLYFYLILDAGPTKATMVTYLSPAVAMLLGWALLGESITLWMATGFLLIIASVLLVNAKSEPAKTTHSLEPFEHQQASLLREGMR